MQKIKEEPPFQKKLDLFRENKTIQNIANFYGVKKNKIDCLFSKTFDFGVSDNNIVDNRNFNLFKRSIWPFLMRDEGATNNVSIIILETINKSVFLGSLVTTNLKNGNRAIFFPAIDSFYEKNIKVVKKGFHISVDYDKDNIKNIHLTTEYNEHSSIMKNNFKYNEPLFTMCYNEADYERCYRYVPIFKVGTKNAEKRFYNVLNENFAEIIKIPYPHESKNIFLSFYFKSNIEDKSSVIYGVNKKEDIKENFKGVIFFENKDFITSIYSLHKHEVLNSGIFFQNKETYYIEKVEIPPNMQ